MPRGLSIHASGATVAAPPFLPLQVVGSRSQVPVSLGIQTNTPAGSVKRTYRVRDFIRVDCSSLTFCLGGYYNAALNLGNDQTVEVALEIGATTVGLTASGVSPTTVTNGEALHQWDAILPSAFGLSKFAKGTQVWWRIGVEVPTNGSIAYTVDNTNTVITGEAGISMATGVASLVTGNGALPGTGGSYTVTNFLRTPLAVLGVPLTAVHSIFAYGDSITFGVGDAWGDGINGAGGWFKRGNALLTNPLPYVSMAVPGGFASDDGTTVSAILASKRWALAPYCTAFVCAYGTNDINGGASAATLTANLQTIRQAAKTFPFMQFIAQAQIIPRTTSTDSWATAANQTPVTGFAVSGTRDTVNSNIAADIGVYGLSGVIQFDLDVEDQVNPSKWITNGTASYPTIDGVHPKAALHGFMASRFAALLNTFGDT